MEARILALEAMAVQATAERKHLLAEVSVLKARVATLSASSSMRRRSTRAASMCFPFNKQAGAIELQRVSLPVEASASESYRKSAKSQSDSVNFSTCMSDMASEILSEYLDRSPTTTALLQRSLGATLWEVAVIMFELDLGGRGVATVVCGLLLDIIVQGMFCWAMQRMATNRMPDPAVLRRWRLLEAHTQKDVLAATEMSFASRVCNFDDSLSFGATQMQLLSSIESYLDHNIGLLLVTYVLVIWFLTVAREVHTSIDFATSLMSIPRASFTNLRMDADGSWTLKAISSRRLFALIALSMVKWGLACWLLVVGSSWLANTKSLGDLVVNAVSLAFILQNDALYFSILVDEPTKALAAAGALQVQSGGHCHRCCGCMIAGVWVRPVVTVLACACFVGANIHWHVLPDIAQMELLRVEACGGNQHFVMAMSAATNEALYVNTSTGVPTAFNLTHNLVALAVDDMVKFSSSSRAREVRSVAEFQDEMTESLKGIADRWPECIDRFRDEQFSPEDLRRLWALRQESGIWDGRHCRDFKIACGRPGSSLLRLLCPQTCGCHDAGSGLMLSGPNFGCPQKKCTNSFTDQQEEWYSFVPPSTYYRECEDISVSTLNSMSQWHRFLAELVSSGTSVMLSDAELNSTVSILSSHGCNSERQLFLADDLCKNQLKAMHFFCPQVCNCGRKDKISQLHCPNKCVEPYVEVDTSVAWGKLRQRPCEDLDIASLNNETWSKAWKNTLKRLSPNISSHCQGHEDCELFTQLEEEGCARVSSLREPSEWQTLCSGLYAPSLRLFCPRSCECEGQGFSQPCPYECSSDRGRESDDGDWE